MIVYSELQRIHFEKALIALIPAYFGLACNSVDLNDYAKMLI